jgi:hypothetical protein
MSYTRLKEKLETILTLPELPFEEDLTAVDCKKIYDILCKIEQGTLIELPCKVGDTIWVVDESWGHREDGTWGSTSEMHEGKVYSFTYYGNCLHVEDDFTSNCYLWGEDAFLTREEAENKLKELQE